MIASNAKSVRRIFINHGFEIDGVPTKTLLEAATAAKAQAHVGARDRDTDSVRVAIRRAFTQCGLDVRGIRVGTLRSLARSVATAQG